MSGINAPPGGKVVQVARGWQGNMATGTTILPYDDSIPQNNEGDQYFSVTITPKNADNLLIIEVIWNGSCSVSGEVVVALFRDAVAATLAAVSSFLPTGNARTNIALRHGMIAGTINAMTFKVRAGSENAGTTTFNGFSGQRRFGGPASSGIMIREYRL